MSLILSLQTRSYVNDIIRSFLTIIDYVVYQFVSILMQAIFDIANVELETINQGIIGKNLKSNCIIIDDNIKEQNKQFIICEDSPFD